MKPIFTLLALLAMCTSSAYGQIVNGSFETNRIDSNDASLSSELADPLGVGSTYLFKITGPKTDTAALLGLGGRALFFRRRS